MHRWSRPSRVVSGNQAQAGEWLLHLADACSFTCKQASWLLLQECQAKDKDLSVCIVEKGSEVGE